MADWETPSFVRIREKRTKRLGPYSENEIWDRIAFSPLFRVEEFESKIKRGDWYLTKEGK